MERPRLIAAQTTLGALYLAIVALGFYVIVAGLGLRQVTPAEALGVFAFSLALGLLNPLPLDLGVIEVGGVGTLVACGVPAGEAVSAMLLQRVLSGGLSLALAGGTAIVFARERRPPHSAHVSTRPVTRYALREAGGDQRGRRHASSMVSTGTARPSRSST